MGISYRVASFSGATRLHMAKERAVRTVSAETDESNIGATLSRHGPRPATPILIARPLPFPDTRPRFARELSAIELRQNRFKEAHGKEVAAKLQQRAKSFKLQITKSDRWSRFAMHPRKRARKFLQTWDSITSLALVYTCFLSPFEAGFVEASLGVDCWVDPWFLANRTLDVIFFVDFVLQFFIVYQGVDDLGDVVWVQDQRKIILRYCGRSFLFDSTSLFIPCYFDIGLAFPDLPPRTPNSGEEGANSQSILRVLRVLRLVKLLRLVRVSKVYKRWLAQMTLSSETVTILTCLLLVTIGSHWFACIIGIQTNLHDELQDTWLGADKWGYCRAGDEPCSIAEIGRAQFYIASLTWGMTIITGTGGTDFYPSPTSTGETLVVLVLVLVGALVWTYVLALFCDMTTNANPCGTHFKQLLDGLNIYIQTHQLPRELALRLREYIMWQKEAQLTKFAEKAVPGLSPALQVETVLYVHRNWLNAVWFFKDLEPSCLVRLAREMQVETFAPGEVTPLHNLYVVSRGLVLYAGRVLRRGMVWGTDILLSYEPYFLRHRARAMSYVDVIVLHRDTLMQVTQLFPPSHKILRVRVVRMALSRHLILTLQEYRRIMGVSEKQSPSIFDKEMGGESSTKFFTMLDGRPSRSLPTSQLTDGQAKATGSNVLYAVRRGLMLAGAPTKDAFGFVTKGAKAEAIYAHLAHTRAVALDCGWRDKQVPQNQIGSDYTAEMQHTELIAVLANLAAEVSHLHRKVDELQGVSDGGSTGKGTGSSDVGARLARNSRDGPAPTRAPPAASAPGADVNAGFASISVPGADGANVSWRPSGWTLSRIMEAVEAEKDREQVALHEQAVTRIQALIRGRKERLQFAADMEAIVKVQALARGRSSRLERSRLERRPASQGSISPISPSRKIFVTL